MHNKELSGPSDQIQGLFWLIKQGTPLNSLTLGHIKGQFKFYLFDWDLTPYSRAFQKLLLEETSNHPKVAARPKMSCA